MEIGTLQNLFPVANFREGDGEDVEEDAARPGVGDVVSDLWTFGQM